MPELGQVGTTRLKLETASELAGEEAWVEVRNAILAEDIDDLDEEEIANNKTQYAYSFLAKIITDWNMTANGEKAPINAQTVKKLPIDDLKNIEEQTNFDKQLSRLKKNNSSSTSPVTATTEEPPSNTSD